MRDISGYIVKKKEVRETKKVNKLNGKILPTVNNECNNKLRGKNIFLVTSQTMGC